jgi:hypothetical protein
MTATAAKTKMTASQRFAAYAEAQRAKRAADHLDASGDHAEAKDMREASRRILAEVRESAQADYASES